jgi:hypothetical protein
MVVLLGWDHAEDCADARPRGYPTWEDKTIHAVRTFNSSKPPLLEKVGAILMTDLGADRTSDWGFDSSKFSLRNGSANAKSSTAWVK